MAYNKLPELFLEEKERTVKALKKIKAPFYRYITVSAAGAAVWGSYIYSQSAFID